MKYSFLRVLTLVLALLAGTGVFKSYASDTTRATTADANDKSEGIGVIFPYANRPQKSSTYFAWGAEVGSSVDLTGNNLTTFDANINCGYRNSFIQLLGLGIGVQRSIGDANTFIPFYGIVRTSFRSRPSNFFFNLKAGYSFNTLSAGGRQGGFLISTGVGMVLKRTRIMQSYIMLAYGFYHINERQVDGLRLDINHIDFAQVVFGIAF